MAFCIINGVTLPVAFSGPGYDEKELGDGITRAYDGTARRNTITRKKTFKLNVPVADQATQEAWRSFLWGDTNHWTFDVNLLSTKSLAPNSSSSFTSGATQAAGGKYGGKLTLAATTGKIRWNGVLPYSDWTVLVWRFESAAWHHYIIKSTASVCTGVWKDGASQSAVFPSWVFATYGSGSTNAFDLLNTAGSSQDFDDLVLLPFGIPAAWASSLYTFHAAQAFPTKPAGLLLTGDIVPTPSTSLTVLGRPGSVSFVSGAPPGSSNATDNEGFSVELEEA